MGVVQPATVTTIMELLNQRQTPVEIRDEDLYFEDGNVILSTRDTEGSLVHFRVHQSILSRQSTVFKDMFSVPSPSEMEVYDGCPLVRLHDSYKELKEFIQAMYDPSFLPFLRLQPNTSESVAGPLKLATKYDAGNLRNRIVSHLTSIWPTTLFHWDELAYHKSTSSQQPLPTFELNHQVTIDFCHNPEFFVSLARECNLPFMFATALYLLCCHSKERRAKLSCLSLDDLQDLILGRESVLYSTSTLGDLTHLSLETDSDACDDKDCSDYVSAVWLDIVNHCAHWGSVGSVARKGSAVSRIIQPSRCPATLSKYVSLLQAQTGGSIG